MKTSDQFVAANDWQGGLLPRDAEAVLVDPEGLERREIGPGLTLLLATKRFDSATGPHVVLVIATESAASQVNVLLGYRLEGAPAELGRLAGNPSAALTELLGRFGLEFSLAGGPREKYVRLRHVDEFSLQVFGADQFSASQFVQADPRGGFYVAEVFAIDDQAYRASRPEHPAIVRLREYVSRSPDLHPTWQSGSAVELNRELAYQRALLVAMFGDPGLKALRATAPGHPAIHRFDAASAAGRMTGDVERDGPVLRALSFGISDHYSWAPDPLPDPFWDSVIQDRAQATMIKGALRDPSQFDDAMVELYVWGALLREGVRCALRQADGHPDVQVFDPVATWIETKRIGPGSKPTRVRSVLSKASRQIRLVSKDEAGSAFVLLSTPIARALPDDAIPQEVDQYVAEARRTMGSGDDTRLGQLVIGWDDVIAHGSPPNPMLYAIRRRTLELSHTNPVSDRRLPGLAKALEMTVVTAVTF